MSRAKWGGRAVGPRFLPFASMSWIRFEGLPHESGISARLGLPQELRESLGERGEKVNQDDGVDFMLWSGCDTGCPSCKG